MFALIFILSNNHVFLLWSVLIHYGKYTGKGGGVIQGTASEAVLVVMLAARKRAVEKVTKEQGISEFEALAKLVAYTSDQAHSCVNKASQVHVLNALL